MINWFIKNWETYKVTNQIPYIFAVWLPFHAGAILGVYWAIESWSWWYILYAVIGWTVFGGVGTAIMLHRYSAHSAIIVRNSLKPMLLWIACMAGQGSPIWWAALHRGYHHAHSDKEKDLHSPTKGFWNAYMGWMFKIHHNSVNLKYAGSLLRDKTMLWFHKHYNVVIWSSICVLWIINPMLCLWFYIIPMLIDLHTDSLVNSLCHSPSHGYRGFDTNDLSCNVWYLGLFGWGQGWHNNHHAKQRSFDFGTSVSGKWYEFDPCLLLVPFIAPMSETIRLWKQRRNSCAG